jgi:hypothetical protein
MESSRNREQKRKFRKTPSVPSSRPYSAGVNVVSTFIDESGKDPNCCFDAEWCADGNQALGHSRYEVDEKLGRYTL